MASFAAMKVIQIKVILSAISCITLSFTLHIPADVQKILVKLNGIEKMDCH